MAKLTKVECDVLSFIRTRLIEETAPPTVREIMAEFGWKSPTWPRQVLKRLHKKKQIVFSPAKSRGIHITDEWATLLRKIARLPIEEIRRIVDECT